MRSMRMENVTFSLTSLDVIKAPIRLKNGQCSVFLGHLGWDINFEPLERNKGASYIARSVVKELRLQSYVSQGALRWLNGLFCEEMIP
ncbi:hypothetical protein IGI04_018609 [Brassica rapa subsp. trilocularis]|uniref:RNase H type-1 domain-containing protein n=1 Tax=Brassica rapa subsp. trilocularis TaxID=1813537 RepID=A0ABQ7MDJ4_BRACM|nr:hypothetical protein IGI04_018609 [Brassica rapa subsp. trilocularis]